MVQSRPLNKGETKMYLIYKRADGVVENIVYRQSEETVEVAVGGDFRKGYVSFTNKEFKDTFLSRAIKILKHKPAKEKQK